MADNFDEMAEGIIPGKRALMLEKAREAAHKNTNSLQERMGNAIEQPAVTQASEAQEAKSIPPSQVKDPVKKKNKPGRKKKVTCVVPDLLTPSKKVTKTVSLDEATHKRFSRLFFEHNEQSGVARGINLSAAMRVFMKHTEPLLKEHEGLTEESFDELLASIMAKR